MKFITREYGPFSRWLARRTSDWAVYCFFVIMGLAFLVGLGFSKHDTDSWRITPAVITEMGTTPLGGSGSLTESKVKLKDDSSGAIHIVRASWWKHAGDEVSVSTDGSVVTSDDQTTPQGIILICVTIGLAFFVVAGISTDILRSMINRYDEGADDRERARREAADKANIEAYSRPESEKAEPTTLAELIELCEQCGDLRITPAQASDYGACLSGIQNFRDGYFPDKEDIALAELIPHLQGYSAHWRWTVRIASARLQAVGVIRPEAYIDQHSFERPEAQLWDRASVI